MAARTFRKKKQRQSRFFFDVIFYVYTHVDRKSEWLQTKETNFVARKTWKCHSGDEEMRNDSGQQGENERQWKN